MDALLRNKFDDLESRNDLIRMKAWKYLMELTEKEVDWVYEKWDYLVKNLDNENSFQRSIAIMMLCNLVKSDKEKRISKILNKVLPHTKDDSIITSRQCINSIWKIAIINKQLSEKVIIHLNARYKECMPEKHYNLLRQDIIRSIKHIYDKEMD
jgi:hypothetical protein